MSCPDILIPVWWSIYAWSPLYINHHQPNKNMNFSLYFQTVQTFIKKGCVLKHIVGLRVFLPQVQDIWGFQWYALDVFNALSCVLKFNRTQHRMVLTKLWSPTYTWSKKTSLATNPMLLVVNAFGLKFVNKWDAEHLLNALNDHYKEENDWIGELLWNHTWMEIQRKLHWHLFAKIHQKTTPTIWTHLKRTTSR